MLFCGILSDVGTYENPKEKIMTKATNLLAAALLTLNASSALAQPPADAMAEFYRLADARPVDTKALESFFAAQFVDHDPQPGAPAATGASVAGFYVALATGSPDSKHVIDYIEPVGNNKALVRWQFVGTHTGDMLGFPASGNKIDISGMELWEFTDGKISGFWHVEELATMFQQLTRK
jgi:steroid delta-isomerase-like uncharacterized protein